MTDRELMQQALDALEYASDQTKPENLNGCDCLICTTILALRERLAQPEQEPVAHTLNCVCGAVWDVRSDGVEEMVHAPTTPQRPWVGLTDEEIIDLIHPLVMADMADQATDYEIARAIEAKLKEKNT